MHTYYIVYKTTNLVTGKYYVGCHQTNNIDDGYIGSGKILKSSISKYGKENFTREVLFLCSSEEEMFLKEEEIVTEDFVKDTGNYNIATGGSGGFQVDKNHKIYSKDHMKRMTEARKAKFPQGVWEGRRHSKGSKDKIKRAKIGNKYGLGNTHSEEFKKKISKINSIKQKGPGNSQFGTKWITNGAKNKKIKASDPVPSGYEYGRTDIGKKISSSLKKYHKRS